MVQYVSRVLKTQELVLIKHIAPETAPSHSDLEPAHLIIRVLHAGVLRQPALMNGWRACRDELFDFVIAFGVPFFFVREVLGAGVVGGESVGPHIKILGDNDRGRGFGVVLVNAEEAAGKVFDGVDYALGLADLESVIRLNKVLIASVKVHACDKKA